MCCGSLFYAYRVVSKSKDTSYLKAIHNALEQTVSIANREALTNPHTFKIIKNE